MPSARRERPALLAFFLPLTRRTCAELRVGDDGDLDDGARAYARAVALGDVVPRRERLILAELATRFELYAGALDYLRKVRFPGLAGPDPVGAFLEEIAAAVGPPSRN